MISLSSCSGSRPRILVTALVNALALHHPSLFSRLKGIVSSLISKRLLCVTIWCSCFAALNRVSMILLFFSNFSNRYKPIALKLRVWSCFFMGFGWAAAQLRKTLQIWCGGSPLLHTFRNVGLSVTPGSIVWKADVEPLVRHSYQIPKKCFVYVSWPAPTKWSGPVMDPFDA